MTIICISEEPQLEYINKQISNGVSLNIVPASRFKTSLASIAFCVPLKKETASANALLAGLLSRKSKEYPDMKSLNFKLAELYGASVNASVTKIGENQVFLIGASCIDDRFSLGRESISFECLKLLISLVFNPKLDENGSFCKADIDAEKRILIEKINSEENEKRIYARLRAEEIMFENEPFAINRYGKISDIEALDAADIYNAWQTALSQARIVVNLVGNSDFDSAADYLKKAFSAVERNYKMPVKSVFIPVAKEVKHEVERIDVKQGKLVIGFRVKLEPDSELTAAMQVFCDIFGGGPYSKLFANVREKMSLCYYCSARYTRQKSFIMIQSGCLEENMDKALDEILRQLDEIKSGNFDEELQSSKMALCDSLDGLSDTPELLEYWYLSQISEEKLITSQEKAEKIKAVTKEDVIKCAELLTLDTVYRLVSEENAK